METDREIVCIVCPNGCRMKVYIDDRNRVVRVENALCRNGGTYAKKEVQSPERSLTSTVKVTGGALPLVSVRSSKPIPRDKIREAAALLRSLHIQAPVDFHQVLLSDILGTGADIIATRQVLKA
ncbi:hypothetical protein CLHUN_15360 [Ruminiclostridium hungatei]|uniref:4Fe-4S Mo/W bis-MGD-type domain-containing protein n=1 Tax=Ruminiclostridium hungatei TaxID=48256 RepID=A0A1V4SL74_RUMHU|nr:DUF1667 domain-containing protein [Ruminiclostridium hungatei]OPX44543.1 hypothetical protein CLHUN_15360 [Ruminiclostridium hungatei]